MQRVGFIGIGLMGSQMSRRILEAKYPLTVWNRKKEKAG
ncbi:MAG: NAD(P)-binding domain-containing protein, partial [Deltaproteobacteria bacterium]|nr:NAD(P)-binding domain-containing protein [Deltaproteobacteria bacterium]